MDGLCSPAELLAEAKNLGHHALAITDHGTLSAHREHQAAAKEAGLKPILGVEAYISETDRFDRRAKKKRDDNTSIFNHIILLAKNQQGVQNLNKLSEIGWTEGFYSKPRIDRDVLSEYGDGLIVLSGCMNGLIAKAIEREDMTKAHLLTEWFKDRFEDDFYMEIQPHNPVQLNSTLLELADMYSIKPVVTNDCHFATEDQRAVEEALLILSTKPKIAQDSTFKESAEIKNIFERFNYLYPDRPISFEKIDVYVQSRELANKALEEAGFNRPDAFENTVEIADKVQDYDYPKALELLPQPKTDAYDRLVKMCNTGMRKMGFNKNTAYTDRLAEELLVIKNKNFSSYFLIEADMVTWARSKDILVGPGRGSAVGSLVCYVLGITQVDPIENGLLFARFINEERNDFPDIDTDFQDTRRGEVREYLKKKFTHVSGISTYSYFRDKGVIRDVARIFYVPLDETNAALKVIGKLGTFEDFETSPNTLEFRNKYPEVLDYARKLRNRIRGNGYHPSGLLIAKDELTKWTPLESRKDENNPVNQRILVSSYDMDTVADIGLIKYDLLGLKTLSVIKDAVDEIKRGRGKEIDLLAIDREDTKVYDMLNAGYTKGVFQLEQPAYTKLVTEMKLSTFGHLVASNALVRPGAMNTVGESFVARKDGREQVQYIHPIMEPITAETYGVVIYQEQVMQTMVQLAGMSWATADKVRKIIGKKKDVSEFDAYKAEFVTGAGKNISEQDADKLWHDFEAHAGYSFNKSHAYAYSMLSFWTAWLKYYWPHEFMYALLKNEKDDDSRTDYLIEAKRLKIRILLPHVDKSDAEFSVEGDAIRFGLGAVKSISTEKGAQRIISGAPYGSYARFKEYASRKGSGINVRMIDSLNLVGGASFDDNPLRGDESDHFYEVLNIPKFKTGDLSPHMKSQITACDDFDPKGCALYLAMVKEIKRGPGWARVDFIDESGSMGVFHTEHTTIEPGQMYLVLVADNRIARFMPIDEVAERADDALVRYLNAETINIDADKYVVISFNSMTAKSKKRYAHAVLSDRHKNLKKILVFNKQYPKALTTFKHGAVVKVSLARTDTDDLYLKDVLV
jgi:DNA polymerase-3 subunit alpha